MQARESKLSNREYSEEASIYKRSGVRGRKGRGLLTRPGAAATHRMRRRSLRPVRHRLNRRPSARAIDLRTPTIRYIFPSANSQPLDDGAAWATLFQHTICNGLTLLAEHMPAMQSAAMTFLVPAGAATDPVDGRPQRSCRYSPSGAATRKPAMTIPRQARMKRRERSASTHQIRLRALAKRSAGAGLRDIVRRPQLPETGARPHATGPPIVRHRGEAAQLMSSSANGICPAIRRNRWAADHRKADRNFLRADHARRYHARDASVRRGHVDFDRLPTRWVIFGDWTGERSPARDPRRRAYHTRTDDEKRTSASRTVVRDRPRLYTRAPGDRAPQRRMSRRLPSRVREKPAVLQRVADTAAEGQGSISVRRHEQRPRPATPMLLSELHRLEQASPRPSSIAPSRLRPHDHAGETPAPGPARSHDVFIRAASARSTRQNAIDGGTVDKVKDY